MNWLIFIVCCLCSIRAMADVGKDNSPSGIFAHGSVSITAAIAAYGAWPGV